MQHPVLFEMVVFGGAVVATLVWHLGVGRQQDARRLAALKAARLAAAGPAPDAPAAPAAAAPAALSAPAVVAPSGVAAAVAAPAAPAVVVATTSPPTTTDPETQRGDDLHRPRRNDMALKNILVHLDSGPRTAERLALAVRIAARNQARLTGVFGQLAEAHRVGVVAEWPPAAYAAAAAESREAFSKTAGSLADAEWVDLNRGGEDEIMHRLGQLACYSDLTVLGQHEDAARRLAPAELATHVCSASGRPVLVVPYAGRFPDVGRRPMFAWSETAGAARALADGLALTSPDAEALLLYAYERNLRSEFAERAVALLKSHGVTAQFEPFALEDETMMDVLLNFASDHGADLMTLGLTGSVGLSLFDRGRPKPTLRELTVPVLCAC
ncbi:hypothetical protein [Rhodoplanes azumiensis]|uniref:Universal stress protein family protein n=1 Tax=Rhodoplanes azumiensis TaxID=1897628 RepID=A0ABW5ALC0_9BRAD